MDGLIIFSLVQIFLEICYGGYFVCSAYEAIELIILVWRGVGRQCCLELGGNPS